MKYFHTCIPNKPKRKKRGIVCSIVQIMFLVSTSTNILPFSIERLPYFLDLIAVKFFLDNTSSNGLENAMEFDITKSVPKTKVLGCRSSGKPRLALETFTHDLAKSLPGISSTVAPTDDCNPIN